MTLCLQTLCHGVGPLDTCSTQSNSKILANVEWNLIIGGTAAHVETFDRN